METRLGSQYGNWACGIVWKLSFVASAETRLGDQCEN